MSFLEIMSNSREMKAENQSKVRYEHVLLIRAAEIDDRFLVNALCNVPDLNVFMETNQRNSTVLHAAAAANAVEVVKRLSQCPGFDVNLECKEETPLVTAVKNNAFEMIEFLASLPGFDVNRKCKGMTPLMIACAAGIPQVVRKLVQIANCDGVAVDSIVYFVVLEFFFWLENREGLL
jgi:ankyrin repeat protein